MIGQNKVHQEVTSHGVSSDSHVATIKNEEWIEDLILINLNVKKISYTECKQVLYSESNKI